MIFSSKPISLGIGRVSTASFMKDNTVAVFLSEGYNLVLRNVTEDMKVSTSKPRIYSYALDAVFFGDRLLERHGGLLMFADIDFEKNVSQSNKNLIESTNLDLDKLPKHSIKKMVVNKKRTKLNGGKNYGI
ncbi:MAG: hypothetical protein LBU60_00215 [Clostridiales bacterium]|jgi:hypothetical protein|nr:hypothetical protein [Clostridiales bacterium]